MEHISLKEVDILRRAAEDRIRKEVQDFFHKTGLHLDVNIITQSTNTTEGKVFSVDVKLKAVIE